MNPPFERMQRWGYYDALNGRPRNFVITPGTLFSPMVTDYTDGYNAGLAERDRMDEVNQK